MVGSRWIAMGIALIAVGLPARTAFAAEATVDAFQSASSQTAYVVGVNVAQNAIGTTTRVDPGLADVIGGVRQLSVTASALDFPPVDQVVSGIVLPPVAFLEYNSEQGADGSIALLYDRNGAGLFSYLAFAQGIQLTILDADAAAVAPPGLEITITLTDTSMNTAGATQLVSLPVSPMAPLTLEFPFNLFPGVNPSSLFSIKVEAEPQIAGDFRFQNVTTYGTPLEETVCDDGIDNNNNGFIDCRDQNCVGSRDCLTQAPALSPTGLITALLLVSAIGFAALRRARRA